MRARMNRSWESGLLLRPKSCWEEMKQRAKDPKKEKKTQRSKTRQKQISRGERGLCPCSLLLWKVMCSTKKMREQKVFMTQPPLTATIMLLDVFVADKYRLRVKLVPHFESEGSDSLSQPEVEVNLNCRQMFSWQWWFVLLPAAETLDLQDSEGWDEPPAQLDSRSAPRKLPSTIYTQTVQFLLENNALQVNTQRATNNVFHLLITFNIVYPRLFCCLWYYCESHF